MNNIIQNNISGIELDNTGTYPTKVQYNLIQNNNNSGAGSGNGIQTNFGLHNALIDNNTFVGHTSSSMFITGGTGSDGVTISNNTLDAGLAFYQTSNLIISDNTSIGNAVDPTIDLAGGNSIVSITGNTLQGGVTGIIVENLWSAGVNSGLTIQSNKFSGNSLAGLTLNSGGYTGTLDASQNWWGSITGPTIASNTNTSRGDSITCSGSATYRPWCLTNACSPVDATTVAVSSAIVTPTTAKSGTVVTVTLVFNKTAMNTALPLTVGLTGITAGTTTVASTSYTGNTWIGTATVATSTHSEFTAHVSVYGGEDTYGNQFMGTESATTFLVDSLTPAITAIDVVQTGANPTLLKIGDTITFTVNTAKAEPGATVSGSYNGHALTLWTPNGGNTQFASTYTVQSGDANQTSPLQITGVTVTDASSNISFAANSTDVTKGIDAHAPVATLANSYSASTTLSTGVTASDSGSGIASYAWSKLSGLGTVTFSDASALNPTVSASTDGSYSLQLVVTDVAGNATTVTTTLHWDTAAPVVATHADISLMRRPVTLAPW